LVNKQNNKIGKKGNQMKHSTLKPMLAIALGGMMIVSQTPAHAQLGGLGKKKTASNTADNSGAAVDKDAFGKSADQVANDLLAARITFLEAKAKMMQALEIKTDSVIKASEALRAKEGSTSEKVKKIQDSSKATADADKEFEKKMAESKELSAESKDTFAQGAAKFIEGALLEKQQIETIQKLVEQGQALVKSAPPTEKAGVLSLVKPVTSMSTIVPGDIKEAGSTLSKMLAFSKNQKIAIPGAEDATAKLAKL
jgi:hypothetical protein